jgi:hypothetical protein
LKGNIISKILKTNNQSQFIIQNLDILFDFSIKNDVENLALESGAMISIKNEKSLESNHIKIFSLKKEKDSMDVKFEYYSDETIYQKLPTDFFDNVPKNKFQEQVNSIKSSSSQNLVGALLNLLLQNNEKPFFLPANRIFLLENADELVAQKNAQNEKLAKKFLELLESKEIDRNKVGTFLAKETEGIHTIHISHLVDEISKLRKTKDTDFIKNGNGFYDDLLSNLVKIMGGEIVMERPSPMSEWEEKFKMGQTELKSESSVQMFLASSSVNQLGTLFMYLKYWAKSDKNFLMIDEPEENLHPKSQIKLINLLLEFANKGNRVLMTTHSPLITEMLNNYLVASQLENKSEVVESLGMVDVDLSPENTAIYYFNGEVVSEHKVFDYGTIFSSFKETQDIVYSVGDYLGELMFKQQNKKD